MKVPGNYLAMVRDAESNYTADRADDEPEPEYGPAPWSIHYESSSVIYPPVGFVAISELLGGDIGNGDSYGYYWPIGREDRNPLVARKSHYTSTIIPIASSIESAFRLGFPVGTGMDELPRSDRDRPPVGDEGDLAERLTIDPDSPLLLVANADVHLSSGEYDRAASLYERAVELFPEYTAAHIGLAVLCRRWRKKRESYRWMIAALSSPMIFWGGTWWAEDHLPSERVLRHDYRKKFLYWLRQARPDEASELADHPLFAARGRLTFASGVTTNDDYPILDESIGMLIDSGRALDAVRLAMLYGELMGTETVSFKERYAFTEETQKARLLRTFVAAGLDERAELLNEPTNLRKVL